MFEKLTKDRRILSELEGLGNKILSAIIPQSKKELHQKMETENLSQNNRREETRTKLMEKKMMVKEKMPRNTEKVY